jgi:hypothetical protein
MAEVSVTTLSASMGGSRRIKSEPRQRYLRIGWVSAYGLSHFEGRSGKWPGRRHAPVHSNVPCKLRSLILSSILIVAGRVR